MADVTFRTIFLTAFLFSVVCPHIYRRSIRRKERSYKLAIHERVEQNGEDGKREENLFTILISISKKFQIEKEKKNKKAKTIRGKQLSTSILNNFQSFSREFSYFLFASTSSANAFIMDMMMMVDDDNEEWVTSEKQQKNIKHNIITRRCRVMHLCVLWTTANSSCPRLGKEA